MTTDPKQALDAAKTRMAAFAKAAPGAMRGFSGIAATVGKDGALSAAQKELVATALAVAKGCDDCILYHVAAAKRLGATEAALVEMLEVCVEMGGGPAIMYAGKALEAYRAD